MGLVFKPGYRTHYNVNPDIRAGHKQYGDNPTGGSVMLHTTKDGDEEHPALIVNWQDGPRGQKGTDELLPPNGAFVEDVLWAALNRLEFFQESKFRCRANALAITNIEQALMALMALMALKDRQLERSQRNVEGKHEV